MLLMTSKTSNAGSESAISIDEYIERGSRQISATRLRALAKQIGQIAAKMDTEQAAPHADLKLHAAKLILILKSDHVKTCVDPLKAPLAEAGVAAEYLLKGMDLIPDQVPEIGLTDDAAIVGRVFARNPELLKLA